MKLVVDSLLTEYEKTGTGKVVVLLHGWGDDHRTYAELQKSLAGYETIALDLPGFGQTQVPAEVWSLDEYAMFVANFLKKLDVEPYAIIGHSNGGSVAIRGLAMGNLKAQKLVLLASAGVRTSQKAKRTVLKVIAKIGKFGLFWLPYGARRALRKKLYGVAGSDMLVAPHLQETFKRTVRQDIQADAARLSIPVLLLYGEQDTATPPTDGVLLASNIPDAKLNIIHGAEHFIHQDQTQIVSDMIKEFLK